MGGLMGYMENVIYLENETLYRGRYRILRKLGEGGSSVVYMAVDEKMNIPVTIKVFKEIESAGIMGKELLEGETKILSGLRHKSIPGIRAVYDDAVVIDYVPGNSLEKVVSKKGRLPEKDAVRIILEVLEVLKYLHGMENPVVYRDLKPANIMLRPDGHISLIDFGTARIMDKESLSDTLNLGTTGFAAPEQYGDLGQTDPRTDIYCLGRTLLLLVGGKCSPELMAVIEKCSMPDRDDRFGSCSEVEKALKRYPVRALIHRGGKGLKLAAGSAFLAAVISFATIHYDTVRSYAADDARERIPAVQERLGNAGTRLKEILKDRFGIELEIGAAER